MTPDVRTNRTSDVSMETDEDFETEIVTLQIKGGRDRTLGFTVVGYSKDGVDHGIFVGCVERGGAAHLSGKVPTRRLHPRG